MLIMNCLTILININSQDEDETQDYLNDGYYDYLFNDDDFFSDDDLDD